jgi:predicted enzyme related to lactoylglutathione lyase
VPGCFPFSSDEAVSPTLGPMPLDWEQVIVDSSDPEGLGRWWASALGWVIVNGDPEEFEIRAAPDRMPGLLFARVPEPKTTKNRLHLDLRPDDQEAEVARLVDLGATYADVGQGDETWVVLADPEGNEFCVLAPRRT